MILGKGFFVTPSDSVAVIAANAQAAIPYFHGGPKVMKPGYFPSLVSILGESLVCMVVQDLT